MFIPQLKDVKDVCQHILKDCRLNSSDECYGDSLNFFMDNGFFSEECWSLDVTLAALILPRLICFQENTSWSFPDGQFILEIQKSKLLNGFGQKTALIKIKCKNIFKEGILPKTNVQIAMF